MIHTIENDRIKVQVSGLGAELQSIRTPDGTEYLWQGDPAYWSGRAYNLFPFVGRMTEGKYTFDHKTYEIPIHGFAKASEFHVKEQRADSIVLELKESGETLQQYPFAFSYQVIYRVEENRLLVTFRVENKDEKELYFGVGGHPGFMVPLEEGLAFEDYCVEFAPECSPERIGISTHGLVAEKRNVPYPLEGGNRIPLSHSLFDYDAIVLKNMARTVTIRSDKGKRAVRVSFPQMDYVGIWQMRNGPYLCIEPWQSLPAREGIVEDIAVKPDLIHLPAGEIYINQWEIEAI